MKPLPPVEAYDLIAPYYDTWYWQKFWHKHELPIFLHLLSIYLSPIERVLDVGVGTGTYLRSIHSKFPQAELYGIDNSKEMLTIAKKHIADIPTAQLFQSDAHGTWAFSDPFCAIIMSRVANHLTSEEMQRTFQNVSQSLNTEGIFIVSDISPTHEYEYTRIPGEGGEKVYIETHKHDEKIWSTSAQSVGFQEIEKREIQSDDGNPILDIRGYKRL